MEKKLLENKLCKCETRITELEETAKKAAFSFMNSSMEFDKRIKNLEEVIRIKQAALIYTNERLENLEGLVNALKERYNGMCKPALRQEPFKCPVCNSQPEYIISGTYKCVACKGNGIVWG